MSAAVAAQPPVADAPVVITEQIEDELNDAAVNAEAFYENAADEEGEEEEDGDDEEEEAEEEKGEGGAPTTEGETAAADGEDGEGEEEDDEEEGDEEDEEEEEEEDEGPVIEKIRFTKGASFYARMGSFEIPTDSAALKKLFRTFDVDGDGSIDRTEFIDAMLAFEAEMGLVVNSAFIERAFNKYDANKDDRLSFAEFEVLMLARASQ